MQPNQKHKHMNVTKLTFEQQKTLYLSLREQYLSDRPMSKEEERTMWNAWHFLTCKGWKWFKIKNNELRENRRNKH